MKNTLIDELKSYRLHKETNKDAEVRDLFKKAQIIPVGEIQLRTYSPTGVHTGNHGVGTSIYSTEPQNRPLRLLEKLGYKFLQGLANNFKFPLIAGDDGQWLEETETPANLDNITYSSLSLSPKRLLNYVEFSNDLVLNCDSDLKAGIEQDMLKAIWENVEKTMINDIYDDTDPTALTDYDSIVDFELAGKDINNPIYLISPTAASNLKKVYINSTLPVYYRGMINNTPVVETALLSGDKVIYGDFSKLVLANWGGIDIVLDEKTKAYVGTLRLMCNSYWNYGILDSSCFLFGTTTAESNEEPAEPTE